MEFMYSWNSLTPLRLCSWIAITSCVSIDSRVRMQTHTRIQSCMHAQTRPYIMCKLCVRVCVQTYTAHFPVPNKIARGFCWGQTLHWDRLRQAHGAASEGTHHTHVCKHSSLMWVRHSFTQTLIPRSIACIHTRTQREHASTHGEAVFVRPAR